MARRARKAYVASPLPLTMTATVRGGGVYPPGHGECGTRTATLTARCLTGGVRGVWVIDGFLSAAECEAWAAYFACGAFEGVCEKSGGDFADRICDRAVLWEDELSERVWERLGGFVPRVVRGECACGCWGKLRLYRYRAGGLFGRHVDESVETKDGEVTGCTVLVYLNDEGLEGGETVFYRGDGNKVAARFTPKRGSLLFHGHGDDCMTHEALPVRKGEKLVLRTDILYTSRDTPYACIDVSATML